MTDKKKLKIGSRGSNLSLAYSNHVKDLLIKSSSEFSSDSVESPLWSIDFKLYRGFESISDYSSNWDYLGKYNDKG